MNQLTCNSLCSLRFLEGFSSRLCKESRDQIFIFTYNNNLKNVALNFYLYFNYFAKCFTCASYRWVCFFLKWYLYIFFLLQLVINLIITSLYLSMYTRASNLKIHFSLFVIILVQILQKLRVFWSKRTILDLAKTFENW